MWLSVPPSGLLRAFMPPPLLWAFPFPACPARDDVNRPAPDRGARQPAHPRHAGARQRVADRRPKAERAPLARLPRLHGPSRTARGALAFSPARGCGRSASHPDGSANRANHSPCPAPHVRCQQSYVTVAPATTLSAQLSHRVKQSATHGERRGLADGRRSLASPDPASPERLIAPRAVAVLGGRGGPSEGELAAGLGCQAAMAGWLSLFSGVAPSGNLIGSVHRLLVGATTSSAHIVGQSTNAKPRAEVPLGVERDGSANRAIVRAQTRRLTPATGPASLATRGGPGQGLASPRQPPSRSASARPSLTSDRPTHAHSEGPTSTARHPGQGVPARQQSKLPTLRATRQRGNPVS
jgi:hypothetical protein